MRIIVGLLACAGIGGLSTALADPPAAPAATAPAATSTPSASSTTSASTASSSASSTPSEADVAEIVARRMKAAGYHEEMHNGDKVWCKDDINTGSRLASGRKTCATAADLNAIAHETQDQYKQLMGPAGLKGGK